MEAKSHSHVVETGKNPDNKRVGDLMRHTQELYSLLAKFPNHSESLKRSTDEFRPTVDTLLDGLVNGAFTKDQVATYLTQERAMQMESGRMDDLSGELKKDQLVDNLQKTIDTISSDPKSDQTVDVYFFDLVNFKNVNDRLGQQGGDRVLQQAAKRFRSLFPDRVPMLGGRIGDEFIYYRIRQRDDNTALDFETSHGDEHLPEKLTTVDTREGQIDVYFHMGKATFDQNIDTYRTERDEHGNKRQITPAKSLLNRADSSAAEDKTVTKQNHPELYLDRHSK